jgi:hypothetical protein
MNFFRPLSVLGTRFPSFLAQPFIPKQKLEDKKKEATESLTRISFSPQSSFVMSYSPPAYKPPTASFQN